MELKTISRASAPSYSVEIRQAYYRYTVDVVVLKGFNMKVPQGNIYALLGSSGCGKTTVLKCLTGQCLLDAGTIKLNVEHRSCIGFMPQNTCLYQEFTVYENMLVFGYLNGMKKENILTRVDELIDQFQLPPGDRFVGTLSGGQQRRVSMIMAFLHKPGIVLLDEPTVGVDINLTQVIWDYFVEQANTGQTIILTTHYIQEATRAHKIGMMRKGILIAEENPQTLMRLYETDNLEDIFLRLSEKQEVVKNRYLSRKESRFPSDKSTSRKPYFVDDDHKISAQRMKCILYKNVVQLSRNYLFMVAIFLMPILQIIICKYVYGTQPKELHIGFVNDEISMHECNNDTFSGCILTNENFRLSCIYMDLFRNRTYKLKEYKNETSVVSAVKKNDIWAALHFVKNYTEVTATILRQNVAGTRSALEYVKINAWVDLSSHVGTIVKREILLFLKYHWKIALDQCGQQSRLTDYPSSLLFQPPIDPAADDEEDAIMSSILPGMLIMLCVCVPSTAAAMTGTEERLTGTIVRMRAAGLSLYEFIIGVLIIHIIFHLIRVLSCLILSYWILGYTHNGSLILFGLELTLLGILGILIGIVSSVITDNPTVTTIMQFGFIYYVSFSAGYRGNVYDIFYVKTYFGIMWPLEGQKAALEVINFISPFPWSLTAAHGITLKDFSFTHESVLEGFGMIVGWVTIFSLIIIYIARYKPSFLVGV